MASFVKEELSNILDNSELLTKRAEAKLHQQRERQYVGRQMAELQDDPRWRTYVQHLNALKEPHASKVTYLQKILDSAGYLEPNEYNKTKFELVREKSIADTYTKAQALIYQLIQDGKNENSV